jgi:hypothetical protein
MRNGSETVIRTTVRAYPEESISWSHCFLDMVERQMVWRSYKPVKVDRFWSVSHSRRRYTKPVFTGFPLQLYGYQTVTADLYLHAFPGGYSGIKLLTFLGGIIENREPQDFQWSTASKVGFCWNIAHDENVFHHSASSLEAHHHSAWRLTQLQAWRLTITQLLGSNRPLPEKGILVVWAFFFDWSMESAKNSYRVVGRQKKEVLWWSGVIW